MDKSTEHLIRFAVILFITATSLQVGNLLGEVFARQLFRDPPCSLLEI
ncbi:hypothetical protein [Synechococcus sp. M16CYN]